MKERVKIVLVLLAAGDSKRFGGNKLLADIDGKPMYRHLADEIAALPGSVFYRKLAVSQYPEILSDLASRGYETIMNKESFLGISHSIQLAVNAMDGQEDAVCFAVCDQPYLKGQTIVRLLEEWQESGKGIGCLSHGGEDGNPAVFARRYERELSELTEDVGGKRVIRRFPEDVYRCEVPDKKELKDIDRRIPCEQRADAGTRNPVQQ